MKLRVKPYRGILLALLAVLAFCLLGPLVVVFMYQDQIKGAIRNTFSANSDQVLSDFDVSLSVLRYFPYATLTIGHVSVLDTSGHRPVRVLGARKIKIKTSMIGLLSGKAELKGVVIEGGLLHQHVDSAGRKTAFRLKTPDQKSAAPDYALELPSVALKNVRITVDNRYKRNTFDFGVKEAQLALSVTGGVLSLSGPVSGKINHLRTKKIVLFRNKPFRADARYTYHLATRTGTLDRIVLTLPRTQFTITGTHTDLSGRQGSLVDIRLRGRIPTGDLLQELLPVRLRPYFDSTDIRSHTYFHYHLRGENTPTLKPRQRLAFRVTDSRVSWPRAGVRLRNVHIAGVFDNGKGQSPLTSSVTIHDLRARTDKGFVQAKMHLANFQYPELEGSLTGNFNLREWAAILQLPYDSTYGGAIQAKLSVKGPVHKMQEGYLKKKLVWEGDMQLQQVAFRPRMLAATCTHLNGTALFSNNLLQLKGITGKLGGKPFSAEATVQDLLRFWFGLSKTVAVDTRMQADEINSRWLAPSDSAARDTLPFIVPAYLQLQAAFKCNRIVLPNDTLEDLTVRLQSDKDLIRLTDLALVAHKGTIEGSASLPNNRHKLDEAQVQLTARLEELDLKKPLFATPPAGSPKATPGSLDLKEVLLSGQSRLSVFVNTVKLPGQENLKDLAVHAVTSGDRLNLTSLHCQTTSGGSIDGKGEAFLRRGQLVQPRLDLALSYDRLNLQNLISLFTVVSRQKSEPHRPADARSAAGKRPAPADYQINFTVTANQLFYEALTGNHFTLKAALHDDQVRLHNVSMQAFGGRFLAGGNLQLPPGGKEYPLQLNAQLQQMDLNQVFSAVDMLGLDVLSSRNIHGVVDCSVFVRTSLDQTFLPSIARTVMYTQASIHNMELIEVEAIAKALHFLRAKKTGHLYFEDVNMKFIMHHGRFIVPGTQLNSNLSHLFLAGTYTMEKDANLHFDVAVLDVLFGNNKRRVEKVITDQELAKPRMIRHLALQREAGQYKLKLFNKQENLQALRHMQEEFRRTVDQYRIDTTFAPGQPIMGKL